MCAQVDRFVSPSHFLRERYVRFGLTPERIAVRDNGFEDRPAPRPGRSDRSPAGGRPLRVVYLGTWLPSKGVHVLLEAVRGLDPAQVQLDVHGHALPYDGVDDYEGRLRALAAGRPHIRLHGAYAPEEATALLSRADVLVVPSIWYENSPLTVHEAWLAGVPVVASGHGGLAELVRHDIDGLHFTPDDAASLRRALVRLHTEEGLLERLRAAIPRVETMATHAPALEAIYREALASRAARTQPQGGA